MNNLGFENKKVAILGLGIEGVALLKFLFPRCEDITLLDIKSEEELMASELAADLAGFVNNSKMKKYFGQKYLDNLEDFDLIFRSPGIPFLNQKIQSALQKGVEVSSQIKLFFDLCKCPIVGVTGTKGKGTTASLLFDMLVAAEKKVHFAGNIGRPAISLIDEIAVDDIAILELSSFQIQDLTKSPHIAIITNISVDHLDYHEDEKAYVEAKQAIVKYQNEDDYAIINQDYLTSFEFAGITPGKVFFFSGKNSVDEGAYVRKITPTDFIHRMDTDNNNGTGEKSNKEINEVVLRIDGEDKVVCRSDEIKLVGKHNLENIAAASVAALLCGTSIEDIRSTVKDFAPLQHRLEFVRELDGIKFFNDSFATNPDPTKAAIRSFSKDKILILGGSSKGASFEELSSEIAGTNVKGVVLIGDEATKIRGALSGSGFSGIIIEAGMDFQLAINKSKEIASSGDIVIFSPSCASFDMFKNYKDRGDQFKKIVLGLE